MKSSLATICATALLSVGLLSTVSAQLDSPGDGTDGNLTLSCCGTTTIDLSQAITGNWDDPVLPENVGKGIYDPEIWAVVFKYQDVSISNRTVRFTNHPSGAPVVWLVEGDATISGSSIIVSGSGIEAGPGGFNGGAGSTVNSPAGAGFGPGGGGSSESGAASGASYGGLGSGDNPGTVYGNNTIFPLIGGSGGSGLNVEGASADYGTGGGGAFMIVVDGTLTFSSSNLQANAAYADDAGGGSGGAIRILANTFNGSGTISALGGTTDNSNARLGGLGRIFVQSGAYGYTGTYDPEPTLTDLSSPVLIFPDTDTPSVRSVSLNNDAVPANPQPTFPEVVIEVPGTYQLVIETENIPSTGALEVRVTPQRGEEFTTTATFASGTTDQATWNAALDLPAGISMIQVKATLP